MINLAYAYQGKKDYAQAEKYYQAATKVAPKFDTAWASYIAMLFRRTRARRHWVSRPVRHRQPDSRAGTVYLWFRSGHLKQFDKSLAEYQKAINADPKNAAAYLHMGQIYRRRASPTGARILLRRRWLSSRTPPPSTPPWAMFTWRRAI